MHVTTTNAGSLPQAGAAMVLLAALVIGGAFLMIEHYITAPRSDDFAAQTQDIQTATVEGNSLRQLAFVTLALFGAVCLACADRQSLRFRGLLPLLLLFYLAWCLASTAWASDIPLTIRRLGALVCFSIGAVGVGRQLSLRQLCVTALCVTTTYAFLGVLVELRLDAFHPWNGEYRFAGSVHPNLQASYCAVLCLAAICLASRQTAVRPLLIGLAVLGGGFLLLTKSRTTTMAFLVALAALGWVRSPSRRQITAGLLFGGLALALVLAVLLGCMDLGGSLVDVALMGRSEGAVSLTGRIPLWIELFDCVRDRLLFGFGYGSFWDPEHVLTASAVVGSGVSHAHSAYMETLVNVGLVGVVTLTFAVALAIGRTARECRHTRDAGCDFLFALLAYGAFQSLLESMFVDTACIPFLTACGLARLALAPADAAPRDGGHQRGADEHAFSGYGPSYPCRDSQP